MTHRTLPTAWFVVFASLAAPSYADEPEFKVALITESRTYERMELSKGSSPGPCAALVCGAVVPQPVMVWINRVTVALDGERITGEFKPGRFSRNLISTAKALAEDFPLDTDVQAAIRGNELRLIHPDGTVVRARIVDRVDD